MSTFKEIITRVDERKPNDFAKQDKFLWLSQLDGRIALDAFRMTAAQARQLSRVYPEDMDREMLVQFPHDELYEAYLEAKIDFANGDYESYQNRMENYNALYSNFRLWLHNTYDPAQSVDNSWFADYFGTGGGAV